MAEAEPGIYHKSIHGGKWLFIGTVAQKLLNVVAFLILARILRPSDYGVMAVVFVVVGLFDVVTTPGFEKALMQRQGEVDSYLDTIWTFKLFKSIFIFFIIFFFAPVIADFFHVAEYVAVIRWGAGFMLITGLSNSREFYFFRNLDFKKIFIRDIITQIGYLAVAISWALFIEASVWALLAGQLTRYLLGLIMSYVLYPQAPRLSFKFMKFKGLWWYSRWVIAQNVLGYMLGIVDSVYVGHFLDSSRLGIYTKARDLAYAPVSPFINAIVRVGFPAYAKVQDKLIKLQQGFTRSVDVVLAITVPLCLLFLVEAGPIVQLLLGKTWLGIVLPLKILSIATIFSTLTAIVKPIFDAVGKPEITVRLNIVQVVCSFIFIYFGISLFGLNGVAVATVLIWFFNFIYATYELRRVLKFSLGILIQPLVSVLFGIAITLIFAIPGYFFIFGHSENMVIVITSMVFLGIIYAVALWIYCKLFKRGSALTFISIFQEVIGRPSK